MWFSVQSVVHEWWLTNGDIVAIPHYRCGAEVLVNKCVLGIRRGLNYLRSSGTLLSVHW